MAPELADPATPNVLVPSHLKSGADILVRADGDVFGGNAEAEGLLQMFGRNLRFGRAQSLQGDVFLQANGDANLSHGNIDALKVVARGVNTLRSPERAIVLVTHYQRLLEHIVPDRVHVLVQGRIVRSGGPELAQELEREGYASAAQAAAA